MDKKKYRNQFKELILKKNNFDIKDKKVNKKILKLILNYKKPLFYKVKCKEKICYKKSSFKINILLYLSLSFEVNLNLTLNFLRKNSNFNVFIPKIKKDIFKLVTFKLPVRKNKYGIKESTTAFLKNAVVDVAVIPVLGIDINSRRIGFGKGMYDKFFGEQKIQPFNIFVSRIYNIAKKDICEKFDIDSKIYLASNKVK